MYAWLIRRCLYPLNEWREGTCVLDRLRFLQRTQFASQGALEDLQFRKLAALLRHAFHNVPFYRRRFQESGMAPEDIRSLEDLRKLPPLTKNDIVRNLNELVARNFTPAELHRAASGGSTGRHTPFFRDNMCLNIKHAARLRFDSWCGWKVGEKVAHFWPAIQDLVETETWRRRLRRLVLDRSLMLNAGNLKQADLARYASMIRTYGPVLIRAFPNPLAVFAQYLRDAGNQAIRPRGVLTTGEPLLPSQRALFQEVFQCPIFNCYASRECGQHACECEYHAGLHINAECLYIEFETDGRAAQPGELGRVLITDLDNFGMPFVRYDIEDLGIPLDGSCSCGRGLPRMAMQAGRVSDYVVSPYDGSLVFGASLCHYMLATGPNVGQIQVIQDAQDHLTIRVRKGGIDAQKVDLSHLQNVVRSIFHGTMRLTFEFCDVIPHERSGKYRFCINRVYTGPHAGICSVNPTDRAARANHF